LDFPDICAKSFNRIVPIVDTKAHGLFWYWNIFYFGKSQYQTDQIVLLLDCANISLKGMTVNSPNIRLRSLLPD
jgi:hypothetical protein